MKKFFSIIISAMILTTLMSVSASAVTHTESKTKADNFKKSWNMDQTYTDEYGTPIGAMQWGYDTVLVNEDYVYTRGKNGQKSQAKLQQGSNAVINGKIANANYISNIMVKHRADNVKYTIVIY